MNVERVTIKDKAGAIVTKLTNAILLASRLERSIEGPNLGAYSMVACVNRVMCEPVGPDQDGRVHRAFRLPFPHEPSSIETTPKILTS